MLTLKESHLTSNMAKKFNDIQPSLLLFLHRLRSITVLDEVGYSGVPMWPWVRDVLGEERGFPIIDSGH